MNYDFDTIFSRKGVNSIKWEKMELMGENLSEDTLPLWVADMDFPCPEPVIQALHKRVDANIFGYSNFKTDKYFNAVINWFEQRFNWTVDKEDIFLTPGVVDALNRIIQIYTAEGNGVIIQEPVYYPFSQKIKSNNREVINNQLINDNGYYQIDFDDLLNKAQNPNNTLMILCSPHNPVGRVWTSDELSKIAEICENNNVTLVSDEVHFDLLREGVFHTPLPLVSQSDKIIVCTAPSKTFNLAGMQCSNIIIRNREQKKLWLDAFGDEFLMNPLSIVAVEAAYEEGHEWLSQVNKYIDDNLYFLDEYLKQHLPLVKYKVPEGTYLAWLDFSGYGIENDVLNNLIKYDAKVLLDAGDIFGISGQNFQRFNVSCPRTILKEALDRITKAINNHVK